MNLYYKIWVDAIVSKKAEKNNTDSWKIYALIPMSLLQGANLFTLFYWMKKLFNRNLPLFIPVFIFNVKAFNSFIAITLTFFVPFMILNYLMIFYNNRYKKLIVGYGPQDGKLYKRYTYISLGILAFPILAAVLFFT